MPHIVTTTTTSESGSVANIHEIDDEEEGFSMSYKPKVAPKKTLTNWSAQNTNWSSAAASDSSEANHVLVTTNGKKIYSEAVVSKTVSEDSLESTIVAPLVPLPKQNRFNSGSAFNVDFYTEREALKDDVVPPSVFVNLENGKPKQEEVIGSGMQEKIMNAIHKHFRNLGVTWHHTVILLFCSFTILKVFFNVINAITVLCADQRDNSIWWIMGVDVAADVVLIWLGFGHLGQHLWDSPDLTVVSLLAFMFALALAWICGITTLMMKDERYTNVYWWVTLVEVVPFIPITGFATYSAYQIHSGGDEQKDDTVEERPILRRASNVTKEVYGSVPKYGTVST